MDWASEEWKQALTPLAAQKVRSLEDRIEILKKERTQKQLQFESLELSLDREKRKTEKEKQNVADIQKELQALSEVCQDYETKHQKLQNELQVKEIRIRNLEIALAQSRKESSKLQVDLKDLGFAREFAQSIQEQKLQKRLQEQNSSKSMIEDSSFNGENAKEIALTKSLDNSEIEASLKRKIEEQEVLINELKLKLTSDTRSVDIPEPSNTFKTPAKAKPFTVTDSPAVNGKNAREVFSSTPSKANHFARGDSNSIDSGSDKIESLQTRLKQLCQELDCQRHNFEASKNALELKYKENESTLKADLKFQMQANTELDKELKELRNKYQQEITQTTKKIDLLTLQLKKSEESKLSHERDIKTLESRLKLNEGQLQSKERELQELHQSLQSKIIELEKNCRSLAEEKALLNENARAIQMQIEGSNNLVKEKETSLLHTQQKLADLQIKLSEVVSQCALQEAKLKETLGNETIVKEQLHVILQEKMVAESNIADFKLKMTLLEEEINDKESCINELSNQIQQLEREYQEKMKEAENALNSSNQKTQSLENKLDELSSIITKLNEKMVVMDQEKQELTNQLMSQVSTAQGLENKCQESEEAIRLLKEDHEREIKEVNDKLDTSQNLMHSMECKLNQLSSDENNLKDQLKVAELEKLELTNQLELEVSKVQDLELYIEEEKQNGSLIKEDLENKCLELEETISALKKEHEKQIQEVNEALNSSKEQAQTLECELKEKLEIVEQEKMALSNHITSEASKVQELELSVEHERENSRLLTEKWQSKCLEFEDLKNEHKTNIHKMEQDLHEISLRAAAMAEKLAEMERLNETLSDTIAAEKNTNETLNFKLKEESSKLLSLEEEITSKSAELEELHGVMKLSKSQSQSQIEELSNTMRTLQDKIENLEGELSATSLNDKNMKEKLNLLEQEKMELSNHLKLKMSEVEQLKLCIEKEKEEMCILKEKLDNECRSMEEHANVVKELENEKMHNQDLEQKLQDFEQDLSELKSQLDQKSLTEASLNKKLLDIEGVNNELSEVLNLEKNKINCCKLELEDRNKRVSALEELLASKSSQLESLEKQMAISKMESEAKNKGADQKFHSAMEQLGKLQNQLHDSSLMEISLKEKIIRLEELNQELADNLRNDTEQTKLDLQEESRKVVSLEQEVSSKSLKIEQYEQEVLNMRSQLEVVETKLRLTAEEKFELSKQFKLKTLEIDDLKSDIESEKNTNLSLKENLQSYYNQIEELNKEIENMYALNEDTELKLKSAEQEKLELSERLELKTVKIQEMNSDLENEKKTSLSLKENLASYCMKIEELSKHMTNLRIVYEAKVKELQEKFSSVESKSMLLENQFKEYSSIKTSAEEKIRMTEKEKIDLLNQLTSAENRIQTLELSIEEERQTSSKLKEEVVRYCKEFEQLKDEMKSLNNVHETALQQLEEKLNVALQELRTSQEQLLQSSLTEQALKEKIEELERLNQEMANYLQTEMTKCFEEESQKVITLQEELSLKSSELDKLTNELLNSKNQFEDEIQSLEHALSSSKAKIASLETEIEAVNSHEEVLNGQLKQLALQNSELSLQLKSKDDKLQQVEANAELENETILQLKGELERNTIELEKLNQQLKDYKDKMERMECELSSSETKITSLERELSTSSSNATTFAEQFNSIMEENSELSQKLHLETIKVQELESGIEVEKEACLFVKEKLENKCLELVTLNKQIEGLKDEKEKTCEELQSQIISTMTEKMSLEIEMQEYKDKLSLLEIEKNAVVKSLDVEAERSVYLEDEIKKLKNELTQVQSEYANMKQERGESSLNEIELKQKLDILVKEKGDLTTQVADVANKYMEFERAAQEQQIKMEEMAEKISCHETHSAALELKLKESSQIEASLKEELYQVEEDNVRHAFQSYEKAEQVKTLKLCIKNIKNEISSMEEKLSSKTLNLYDIPEDANEIEE